MGLFKRQGSLRFSLKYFLQFAFYLPSVFQISPAKTHSGKRVLKYAFSMFFTRRLYEQFFIQVP
ncbi:hypothetical protein BCY88_00065 [Paraburkholderia fungorum]|uniref:Uncharacterized protein n=1 Tax=Paraburkholderia fungorum TaxID=134537 RepID=A0A3R7ID30_9BURK|nr:hypothetical protein BCY88_00065 [Paraburkholderia fungorum]